MLPECVVAGKRLLQDNTEVCKHSCIQRCEPVVGRIWISRRVRGEDKVEGKYRREGGREFGQRG